MILTTDGKLSTVIYAGDRVQITTSRNGTTVSYTPVSLGNRNPDAGIVGMIAAFGGRVLLKSSLEANELIHSWSGDLEGAEKALFGELEEALSAPAEMPSAVRAWKTRMLERLFERAQNMAEDEVETFTIGEFVRDKMGFRSELEGKRINPTIQKAVTSLETVPGIRLNEKLIEITWDRVKTEATNRGFGVRL